MRSHSIVCAVALLAACGTDVRPDEDAMPQAVYYGQVERIIHDNCIECHSTDPDRLAPFSLATYEDVLAAAEGPLAQAVQDRSMPPFYADQDNCNTFSNAKWLSQSDIDTIGAWAGGERLAGDPADSISTPPPMLPTLPRVDRVLDTGAPYTPTTVAGDEFRCFLVDAIPAGTFVVGAHVKPTNLTVAHHVILFSLDDQAAEDAAIAAAATGPYPCDGGPTGGTFLTGWAPGTGATAFPADTGIATNGRKMVVQIHYNTTESNGLPDHTTIDLELASSVAKPARILRLGANIDLAPNDPDATATAAVTLPGSGPVAKLWGTGTHMHQRGTGARVNRNNTSCLVDLINWDFHWQHFYWYDTPVVLNGGDRIDLTCHYDTTQDTQRVGFCETTECEMCIQFSYVTAN